MPPCGFKPEYVNPFLEFIKGLYLHLLEEAKERKEDPKITIEREIENIGKHLLEFKLEEK